MMDPHSLAIPFAFILLSALLCLLLIGSKWKWWQKLALIVIVPSFGLVVWSAISSYKGWPTTDEPQGKFLLHWVLVREPDPANSDPGAIYLWLYPLEERSGSLNPLDYDSPGGEPRAYKLPYSRPTHKGAERAKGMLRSGRPVVFDGQGGQGDGNEGDGEGGEGDGEGDGQGEGTEDGQGGQNGPGGRRGYGYEENRRDPQFYELPPPAPPKKGSE